MSHFVDAYTKAELDSGFQMNFHPISGERLTDLTFVPSRREYVRLVPRGAWDSDPDWEHKGRISSRGDVSPGDAYPNHWKVDPWTGEDLNPKGKRPPMSRDEFNMLCDRSLTWDDVTD